ncbi:MULTISPECIES: hypothetical protein [unclassified Pseudoalteromonas]|uniref:hypothetical protein n=1 Tax=unclassified Pseudoalteromonas TaxID=194690 RepID=UPI000C080C51|nr:MULTISPECIES: hypothetical protein [unclassified Pseudoalteromonas]MDP2633377.1 hypothetical protein [Pseudoalteromonas sp. 1_MG-2023]PHN91656.1 hypothetical protein CSC79_01045 [Pseudoalteromonas sp. 3D05]
MKSLRGLAFVAFVIMISVLCSIIAQFGFSPDSPIEQWGAFGDFIGGTLNPIFAFLSFICLLMTIVLQNTELKETRKEFTRVANANEQQLSLISNQQQKDDTYKVIQKVTERLNKNYNENRFKEKTLSLHKIILGGADYNKNLDFKFLYEACLYTNSDEYKIIKYIEKDLFLLKDLLENYDKLTNFETGEYNPLINFYRNEYLELVQALGTYNLVDHSLFESF